MDTDLPTPDDPDEPTSARDTRAYPAGVALMYLDRPVGTLTPAQVAFLLGNDAGYIEELMLEELEEAAQWAEDALAARRGEPDPVLVDASPSGTVGLEEACLHEARACEMAAQAKRAALHHLRLHPAPIPVWSVAGAMDEVQSTAEARWGEHRRCAERCSVEPAACARHAMRIRRLEARHEAAVTRMRAEFLAAFAEHGRRAAGG